MGLKLQKASLVLGLIINVMHGHLNAAQSFDGSVELEHRQFFEQPPAGGVSGQTSVALSVDFFKDWNKGDDRLEIELFGRADEADDERTHLDVRQFLWTHYGDDYEFSAGIGRVFWGVTETQHLVDIINQTDLVDNIDGEDKLGQPMLRYQRFTSIGSFEGFILPYFRERTFEGEDGRLNAGIVVDDDNALYESSAQASNIDVALRYSHAFGPIDVGLSWFSGTSREPDLFLAFNPSTATTQPFYPQIDQFGADVQLTQGSWLLKLEAIQRNFDTELLADYAAATVGVEYTVVGVFGTNFDLGLLSEYSWDERREQAVSPFQNDLFFGARLALNDIANSQFLFGVTEDLDFSGSQAVFLEGSTRINNKLSLNIEARLFDASDARDPIIAFRDSSFIQIGLEFFFD